MSVLQCNFYSKCLMSFTDVTVYIPSVHNGTAAMMPLEEIYKPRKYKVIYLLHGMLDDHSCWMRWSNCEAVAEEHEFMLVMPSGQNGYYINAAHGLKYYDFISKELPMWVEANFPVLTGRENTFIAGLSMGGYGALRHGLSMPERYAAVGAFSPACDVIGIKEVLDAYGMSDFIDYDSVFGGYDAIKGTDNDLYALMDKCIASGKELPKFYMGCGTDDFAVYKADAAFAPVMKEKGFDLTWVEMEGTHEWKVWQQCFKEFVEMIDA